jgi:hypothetical protein
MWPAASQYIPQYAVPMSLSLSPLLRSPRLHVANGLHNQAPAACDIPRIIRVTRDWITLATMTCRLGLKAVASLSLYYFELVLICDN